MTKIIPTTATTIDALVNVMLFAVDDEGPVVAVVGLAVVVVVVVVVIGHLTKDSYSYSSRSVHMSASGVARVQFAQPPLHE